MSKPVDPALHFSVQDRTVPPLIYGTAWKKERTAELTLEAIRLGYRGIDTANQRRHYLEEGAGEGIARAIDEGVVGRDELFVQTKFTYLSGQGEGIELPYDPEADVDTQVEESFESSLEHLGVDYVDALLLHSPAGPSSMSDEDWAVWEAFEGFHEEGRVRMLGVCNITNAQLHEMFSFASIKPALVQNRCFADAGWDREVRRFCEKKGMLYQGFSLLTANPQVLEDPWFRELAGRLDKTTEQAVFRFARAIGMVALTGTTQPSHMADDLGSYNVDLTDDEVAEIETRWHKTE